MPYRLQSCATARPMPEAPPVMRAVALGRKTGWGGIVGSVREFGRVVGG